MTSKRTFFAHLRTIVSFFLISWIMTVDTKITRLKYQGRGIPQKELDTRYSNTKKKIVLIHNFYRAKVEPSASNMLEMTWHKGAQRAAQGWAEACQLLVHDDPLGRWVEDYGSCGQNIFVSSIQVDWMFVAKAWYMEHKNFTYGSSNNNVSRVGHYTQMVWYNSHRVGCGFHYCGEDIAKRPFYNYVCNYCPIGNNPKRLGKPYKIGKPCEKCPKYCKYKKLCTNSCPFSDLWSNCRDLNSTWNSWLCGNEGHERFKGCQATCRCPYSIL